MKLCRFELLDQPGVVRSGMVYSGKVYETDGAQAVAVHEAETVRPLAPIAHAGSLRLFRTDLFQDSGEGDNLSFFYGNPMSVHGASQLLPYPSFTGELTLEPYVAAVMVAAGQDLDLAQGDDIILGLTILNVLVASDLERRMGRPGGPAHDFGATVGPVLTTPDELDEAIIDSENGRRYELAVQIRVNGVETHTGNLYDLPVSFSQAVAFASRSCMLHAGDLIAIGPIVDIDYPIMLQPGDEVQVSVERLGMLATKLS